VFNGEIGGLRISRHNFPRAKGGIPMRRFSLLFVGLFATLAWAFTSVTLAQLNPFDTGGAERPLLDASPTGGLDASTYTGRARAAAEPAPAAGPSPFSRMDVDFVDPDALAGARPAAAGAAAPGPPAPWVAASAPGQGPTPTPTPVMVMVIGGQRVRCVVCGTLLEDVRRAQVPEIVAKTQFHDDGTHGDAEAGDGEYTNITEHNDEFLGPECNALKQRLLSLLHYCEETDSLQFFRLYATTTEPISQITKSRYEEQERDAKLKEWNERFLRMFRKNPDDPTSGFYPLYVPIPPKPPEAPMPPGFNPILAEQLREEERRQQQQQQQQVTADRWGGARGGETMGGPAGSGASSAYFR